MLNIPVVYVCFNRSKVVEKTFQYIVKQKPKKLYIIMDGPRLNNDNDKAEIEKIKKYIQENVTWQCQLFKIYSNYNLGLKKRIISGLNEVFDKNENAIVLEDDCLPHKDFFFFCEKIHEKYKDSKNVKFITGNNFQKNNKIFSEDYYFSKYSHIWGWSCTKDLWYEIKFDHIQWESFIASREFQNLFEINQEYKYWVKTFNLIGKGGQASWSIYLLLTMWKNNYLTATPNINLVQNLGLENGTNTKSLNLETQISSSSLNRPLVHPLNIERNIKNDKFVFYNVYKKNVIKKIYEMISSLFQ